MAKVSTVVEELSRNGCTSFSLETFSFRTPSLYRSLGHQVEYERRGYPHGIVKYHVAKEAGGREAAA